MLGERSVQPDTLPGGRGSRLYSLVKQVIWFSMAALVTLKTCMECGSAHSPAGTSEAQGVKRR